MSRVAGGVASVSFHSTLSRQPPSAMHTHVCPECGDEWIHSDPDCEGLDDYYQRCDDCLGGMLEDFQSTDFQAN
jgi:predicted RNA-binding Zn-ribbon protein involved in translation (DUF1610 family)